MGCRNSGTVIGDTQVGELPIATGGDDGTETGDSRAGRWICVVYTVGKRVTGAAW